MGMSPHREFHDDNEQPWSAWDVVPSWGERRHSERRGATNGPPVHAGERRRVERRVHRGIRISLTPVLAHGWLAFQSGKERRRLAPIPPDWHLFTEDRLRELWRAAEQLPPRRRLVE